MLAGIGRWIGLAVLSLAACASPAQVGAEVRGGPTTSGLRLGEVRGGLIDGRPALAVEVLSVEPLMAPGIRVEANPSIAFGAPVVTPDPDGYGALVMLPVAEPLPGGAGLAGRALTLTLVDGPRTAEVRATVAPGGEPLTRHDKLVTAASMLGLAFLGGLILNLMPCVLPVLSLKLFALARHGGAAPATVRAGFLASAAGIVVSVLILALGLILLRKAGGVVGWGIQFQQPGFIAAMIVVVTLFACNLWGLFEIRLPRRIADAAGRRAGPDEGLAGHFVTGLFATLLATPCSAPFLGTAVGFALSRNSHAILGIFLALGLGLAAPYLAVAAFPRVALLLPKPGRWMLWLRWVLGFALAATALWLLGVLEAQVGTLAAIAVAVLMLAMTALLALDHRMTGPIRRSVPAAIAGLVVATVALPVFADGRFGPAMRPAEAGRIAWVPFDRGEIRGLVAEGRTVFVDVTADWCVSCQVNKRVVTNRAPVADRLSGDVVPMKADWTRPDPKIGAFLASYGRYGIPFNIVYGPGAPSGIALPEVLTSGSVLDALAQASAKPGAALAGAVPAER